MRTQGDADGFNEQVNAIAAAHGQRRAPALSPRTIIRLSPIWAVSFCPIRIQRFAWPRRAFGQRRYSLWDYPHHRQQRAMDQFGETLLSPLQSWDAIICTSRSVRQGRGTARRLWRLLGRPAGPKAANGGATADHSAGHRRRTGDQRRGDAAARAKLRSRLGIGDDDVVILFFGRLSFTPKRIRRRWPRLSKWRAPARDGKSTFS